MPPAQLFWYCAHDASCDAAAALAAGFQPSCPSLSETKVFANLGTVSLSGNYLEARNHVLIQWTSDVTHYLTIDSCLKHIPPASHILVTRVYDFLETHGHINVGVFRVGHMISPQFPAGMSPHQMDSLMKQSHRVTRLRSKQSALTCTVPASFLGGGRSKQKRAEKNRGWTRGVGPKTKKSNWQTNRRNSSSEPDRQRQ